MIEINIGSLQIKIGRQKPLKVNMLEPMKMNLPYMPDVNVEEITEIVKMQITEPNAHPQLKDARMIAIKHGWREVWHRIDEGRVRFKKGKDDIVDVWYTKMTVGTIITHPSKGRGQLFRKHVSKALLEGIFKNPRVHTGEGYYKA